MRISRETPIDKGVEFLRNAFFIDNMKEVQCSAVGWVAGSNMRNIIE
jgi:hypothetical protein